MDSENGLIHSVQTTGVNVHDLSPAAELLHGEETVVYADAGYQGIEESSGKCRASLDTPQGRVDDLIETA